MPYLAHLTVKLTRKFQIGKDDWLGVDALATVAVEEAEANLVDPADIRRMAREQAKLAVAEQIAEEIAERAAARQREAAPAGASFADTATEDAPTTNGHRPPPATAAEAEQRFFARYAETIGGQDWKAVQGFLRRRTAKPITVEGWIAAAEAVRDHAQAGQ